MSDTHTPLAALAILNSPQERTVHRNATEARRQFFALLGEVAADPDEVVEIQHKDLEEPVLLVNAHYRRYVRQLERLVHGLRSELAVGVPFRLGGTVTLEADMEAALAAIRDEQRHRTGTKFVDL